MSSVVENPDALDVNQFLLGEENVLKPLELLNVKKSSTKSVLLVLNQNITVDQKLFADIWKNSDLHVCADGGSNRLRAYNNTYKPEYIIGDLDSITQETKTYYSGSSQILLQSSQFFTDLDKALALINIYFNFNHLIGDIGNWDTVDEIERRDKELSLANVEKLSQINVVILGAIGGRFDQTINAISKMVKLSKSRPNINAVLLNPEHTELILLMPSGRNFVDFERLSKEEEAKVFGTNFTKSRPSLRNVGVLPLLQESVISTHGLKWDVTNWPTSMIGDVSSCNLQVGNQGFIVETKNPLFINIEL